MAGGAALDFRTSIASWAGALPVLVCAAHAANVSQLGQATVAYVGEGVHVVVAYDHARVHHADRWVLFDVGIKASRGYWLKPGDLALQMPDGRVVLPPSPAEVRRNAGPVTALFQRVTPSRTHTVDDVFLCQRGIATCQRVNFWKMPTDRHAPVGARHAARFDVIFESPDAGGWPSGEYSLLIHGKHEVVRVPLQFV